MARSSEINAAETPRLLSRREAAWFLGVSIRKLDAMIAEGVLARVKLPSVERTLLDRVDLEALVKAGKVEPA